MESSAGGLCHMLCTVPALCVDIVVSVLGLHDITFPKCVDSSVVCESSNCVINRWCFLYDWF